MALVASALRCPPALRAAQHSVFSLGLCSNLVITQGVSYSNINFKLLFWLEFQREKL